MSQVIYTIDKIPKDIEKYFKTFVKVLCKEEIMQMDITYRIIETEQHNKLSSAFKITPALQTPTDFKVVFEKKDSTIDVLYDSKVEVIAPGRGMALKHSFR